MELERITPLILTLNEAANLGRCLEHLRWARRVVIIDSRSTDETVQLAQVARNVDLFQRSFDTHAKQWNYGLSAITSEWVLSLDADYLVTEEFKHEIQELPEDPRVNGYEAPFKYCIRGQPLRVSILPPRVVLFRRSLGEYYDDGHTQRLHLKGAIELLRSPLLHDDQKPLKRWLKNQRRYAELEASKLLSGDGADIGFSGRIRKALVAAPILVPLYFLFWKGGILDGWRGGYYAFQRFLFEVLLSSKLAGSRVGRQRRRDN